MTVRPSRLSPLSAAAKARIEAVARQRLAIPTDKELARELGLTPRRVTQAMDQIRKRRKAVPEQRIPPAGEAVPDGVEHKQCPYPEMDGMDVSGRYIGSGLTALGVLRWHPQDGTWRCHAHGTNGDVWNIEVRVAQVHPLTNMESGDHSGGVQRGRQF